MYRPSLNWLSFAVEEAFSPFRPPGAAEAGPTAREPRRRGNPTANAAAFRSPPAREGLFPVSFTCDPFTMYRQALVGGPDDWNCRENYKFCNLLRPDCSQITD